MRGMEVPISPRRPGSAKAGTPPGRPALTRSEGPGDKHSGQRELQSQRAHHSPLPAKTLGPSVWLETWERLQEARVGPARGGGPEVEVGWHPLRV